MRVFTKISKPPFSRLRKFSHASVVWWRIDVDEWYLKGDTSQNFFRMFLIPLIFKRTRISDKSRKINFKPKTNIVFLVFVISSKNMTLTLTLEKKTKIKTLSSITFQRPNVNVRDLQGLSGKIFASFPAVSYGPRHYWTLEVSKTAGMKYHKEHFDWGIILSANAGKYVQW